MKDAYDFVVIGGGSAGFAAAAAASQLGLSVAVVEGARDVGGLCILRGCMPSKTLIESANRFSTIRHAREFGLRAEETAVHGSEIIARKRRLIGEFAEYRRRQLETGAFDFIRGWAGFIDPHTISVRATGNDGAPGRISAKSFLIATGSTVKHVKIPGLEETGYLDSDTLLEAEHIPKSVVVLGGGAIAMEAAHYFAGLGVEVTILQRSSQILKETDGDVAQALTDAFSRRSVRTLCGTSLVRVEKTKRGKCVHFQHEGADHSLEAEEILYALGRVPQFEGLGLEAIGVAVQQGRLSVNTQQQTSLPHIFAAGDAAGPHEIVHIAIQQGEIAARNAARIVRGDAGPLESIDYRLKLFVVFTEPQVASVGYSERELMSIRADYGVARYPFADHGKSMVKGETDGFVKLIAATGTCKILGAAAVGPEAGELIHEMVVAMHFHATVHDVLKIPHYHPTLSEIWTYPAEELALD